MSTTSRKQAKLLGEKKYFTGQPCKRGHVAERYTATGICLTCNSEHNKTESSQEAKRRYVAKDPEAHRQRGRNFYNKNLRSAKEKGRSKNPGYRRAKEAFRRASKKKATPRWLTENHKQEMQLMYSSAAIYEHTDHIVPIVSEVVCGLHVPWNLRNIPKTENESKGNKLIPALSIAYSAPGWEALTRR